MELIPSLEIIKSMSNPKKGRVYNRYHPIKRLTLTYGILPLPLKRYLMHPWVEIIKTTIISGMLRKKFQDQVITQFSHQQVLASVSPVSLTTVRVWRQTLKRLVLRSKKQERQWQEKTISETMTSHGRSHRKKNLKRSSRNAIQTGSAPIQI